MPELDPTQRAAYDKSRFFATVCDFVIENSTLAALRDSARDKPLLDKVWSPHWPRLQAATPPDATLFMCFLLACATLRIDVERAAAAIGESTDPALCMKLFLAERGLIPLVAFEGRTGPAVP